MPDAGLDEVAEDAGGKYRREQPPYAVEASNLRVGGAVGGP